MNNDKHRKSEAQKTFEEADNAGRFSGGDTDAAAAREQAVEHIRQDTDSTREERDGNLGDPDRPATRTQDFIGDSQNVTDNGTRPLNDEELEHARNKATEGQRQERSDS